MACEGLQEIGFLLASNRLRSHRRLGEQARSLRARILAGAAVPRCYTPGVLRTAPPRQRPSLRKPESTPARTPADLSSDWRPSRAGTAAA
eukprot:scaffold1577_cov231-Prasinococcus_capsulatus_cf.AAC.3